LWSLCVKSHRHEILKRTLADGSIELEYWIELDTPQCDLTDDMHGQTERTHKASTVMERYLQHLTEADE